jgi:GT2 family glycosyltransferase
MFNPLSHPICFTNLQRLAPSTWIGHAPFAMFLTDILQPEIIVELGTYFGTSYCAFCQAVDQLKLNTKCYAVDTWRGDSQSGFFGVEVLEDLRAYHDPLYGKFSRLIQSTFDQALVHFDDNSIDLLHIDGFHTYDEVKKDFEKWIGKTSERGIVLFHDINVKEKDFGVWQFWNELKFEYPSFEFIHSHGLGVLATGKKCPQTVLDFLDYANKNSRQIRDFFYQLGLRFEIMSTVQDLRQALKVQQNTIESYHSREESLQDKEEKFVTLFQLEQELEKKDEKLQLKEEQIHLDFQLKEELISSEEKRLQLRIKETELSLFDLQNERASVEEQRKRLVLESQQLFAKRLELQRILLSLDDKKFTADNLTELLETRFSEIDFYSKTQILKFVIGIVTYNNSQEEINQLLKSVKSAINSCSEMYIKFEIYVVDNGQETSWDDSELNIAKYESLGNIGFGKGMNHLMSHAFADPSTQWFLCLNPDGILHHKALNELIKSSKSNPHSLIEARQFPEEHLKDYDTQTLETLWASGACLLIPKGIFEKTKGFDSNFFMYLEDVDLSWRVRSAGFSVKIAPKALFGHSVLERSFNPNSEKYFFLSGRYLAYKWKNKKFAEWTEKELVQRGHYPSIADLPKLPEAPAEEHINLQIADFNYHFHFSPARW